VAVVLVNFGILGFRIPEAVGHGGSPAGLKELALFAVVVACAALIGVRLHRRQSLDPSL
jgi:hypothetical protein